MPSAPRQAKPSRWRLLKDAVRSAMNDPAPGFFWWSPYTDRWIPDVVRAAVPQDPNNRPPRLQGEGQLTKEQLRAFFAAASTAFDHPVFQHHLRSTASRGKDLSRLVNELQIKIFEALGIYGKFGLAFLGRIRDLYGDDPDFMLELLAFVDREQRALDESGAIGYAVN
eukprot:evm.model.scf_4187.1 EVM.evm.TU.scf_4187.1   scf_4187:3618-7229(+)